MRQSVKANPTKAIWYTPLTDDLADAMIQAYQLGYNQDGSTLRRPDRASKRAEFRRKAREFLLTYQKNANRQLKATYKNAIDAGKSHTEATKLTSRRFRTLGMNAPVSNGMKTTYETAIYGAYMEGLYDASQNNQVVGYRYWTQEDERVRNPEHTQFQGVTLPKGNKFWKKYWPPIAWNCRCYIQTLKRKPKGGWVMPPANPVPIGDGYEGQEFRLV
jgi:hypothetical protein